MPHWALAESSGHAEPMIINMTSNFYSYLSCILQLLCTNKILALQSVTKMAVMLKR